MRKATPTKSASAGTGSKSARPSKSKQTKAAPPAKKTAKTRAATPAPSKSTKKIAARPVTVQSRKSAPVKSSAPAKSTSAKTTATAARSRPVKPSATKSSGTSKPHSARPSHPPTPPRQPTRDEAAALRAFERAHKEFVRGRFADARMSFRTLIEQHAGVAEVTARARTYLAIAEARLRSENNLPRDAEALYDRGVIELNRGDYVAAQEMFERALKQDDKAADIHYALAAARARLGSIVSALQSLERALDLRPNLRVRAQHDLDLSVLRNEPDFERLVFPASRP
ncbi:MAG TPA: tetratricopeptide repeat protein [Pyrinomonadaceae bacterium]